MSRGSDSGESAITRTLGDGEVHPDRAHASRDWRRNAALALLVAFIGLFGVGVGGVLNYELQRRSTDSQRRRGGRTALLLIYDDLRRNQAALEVARVTNNIPDALPLATRSWDSGRGDVAGVLSTHQWLILATFFGDAAILNGYSAKRDHPSATQARQTIRQVESDLSKATSVCVGVLGARKAPSSIAG